MIGPDDNVDRAEIAARLLRPLRKALPPPVRPWSQRASAWLSAAALVVLVALYAVFMFTTVWYALDYLLGHLRPVIEGGAFGTVLGYLVLGLVVLAVTLLLLKPAFHLGAPVLEPLRVSSRQQPLLHRYVDALCEALQAPAPRSVRIVPGAEAAVIPGRGLRGLLSTDRDLVLGLTLAAGMNVRQFTAVLAHELGHLSKRRAMRVQLLINGVNLWFARAVYERDRFDLWLTGVCERLPWLIALPFHAARGVVGFGRFVLWVFMMLGHLASCMISRRDEYDSDIFTARVVGSEGVAEALQRTMLLSLAEEGAHGDLAASWEAGRLTDNVPRTVVAKADRLPAEQQERFLRILAAQPTRSLDTHPSLSDRIRAVQTLHLDGVLGEELPATTLFSDFDALCRTTTESLYRHMLGEAFTAARIVPYETLVREHRQMEEGAESLTRYCRGNVSLARPLFPYPQAVEPSDDGAWARRELEDTRSAATAHGRDLQRQMADYAQNRELRYQLAEVQVMLTMGFTLPPLPALGLTTVNAAAVSARKDRLDEARELIVTTLEPMENDLRRRMTLALGLLHDDETWENAEDFDRTPLLAEVARLVPIGPVLEEARSTTRGLALYTRVLGGLLSSSGARDDRKRFTAAVSRASRELCKYAWKLRESLKGVPYPFEHARENVSIGEHLIEKHPEHTEPAQALWCGIEALDRFDALTWQIMARLAWIAEHVEVRLGMEVLAPEPEQTPPRPVHVRRDRVASGVPALAQGLLALFVAGVCVGAATLFTEAAPKYAVLPKHDYYRPTIVPQTWSPPPHATVWNMGSTPYRPGMPGFEQPYADPRPWEHPNRYGQTGYHPPGSINPMTGRPYDQPRPGQPGYHPPGAIDPMTGRPYGQRNPGSSIPGYNPRGTHPGSRTDPYSGSSRPGYSRPSRPSPGYRPTSPSPGGYRPSSPGPSIPSPSPSPSWP